MTTRTRRGGSRQTTISEVAAAAGVSTATVSRVLSGRGSVRADLAERVHEAVLSTGYHPNEAARVLSSGRHRNVAVVIPDAANPYFLEVTKALLLDAAAQGHRTLVADSQGDPAEELSIARSLVGTADGIVLMSSRIEPSGLRELARLPVPVVLVNRVERGVGLPVVAVDNLTAMLGMCGHLAELGHRRVAYLGGSPLAWQDAERWRAVQQASVMGLDAVRVVGDGSIEAGRAATDEALRHDPTALVCFNDLAALGAVSRLREIGLRVPEDVSVTGFDDIDLARYGGVRLTTAVSPKVALGRTAWSVLHGVLTGAEPPDVPLLRAELVIGESTGPARR